MISLNSAWAGRLRIVTEKVRGAGHSPWNLFWLGLVLRVVYITLERPYVFRGAAQGHFNFGWELGRIAAALADGRGYSDPFVTGTGPTSWLPPLYTLLLAAVFKTFGTYSLLSGWVILVLNSICNCAVIPAIYEIACRCYNRRIAAWSAWLWTLYPAAMQYAVRWVWEMSLTCMLFAWILVLALRLRGVGDSSAPAKPLHRTRQWCLFGSLWGLTVLSNSTLLLVLPACGIWLLLDTRKHKGEFRRVMLAATLFAACLFPWMYRNWTVFHHFIPLRGNLGAELWEGNGPHSTGFPWGNTLPIVAGAKQIELYRSMGEVRYVQMRGEMAKAYIAGHRAHFLLLACKRFYFMWAGVPHPSSPQEWVEYFRELNYCTISLTGLLGLGLSLRRKTPAAGLFGLVFLLAPLTYYFVTPGARFRHPLEPLILIFTVYLFQSAQPRSAEAKASGALRSL